MKWVNNLKWEGKEEWDATIRNGFSVDNYFEGNVKKYGNLAVYWVDRSGHMVCTGSITNRHRPYSSRR